MIVAYLERVTRIELVTEAWEAFVIPFHHTRHTTALSKMYSFNKWKQTDCAGYGDCGIYRPQKNRKKRIVIVHVGVIARKIIFMTCFSCLLSSQLKANR